MPAKWLPPNELAERVRELRARLGVTQAGLAEIAGRPGSQSEIGKLETGRWKGEEPNVPLLAAIADAAGETLGYFREVAPEDLVREKLIAARWMERLAAQLRAEATSAPGATKGETAARRRASREQQPKEGTEG